MQDERQAAQLVKAGDGERLLIRTCCEHGGQVIIKGAAVNRPPREIRPMRMGIRCRCRLRQPDDGESGGFAEHLGELLDDVRPRVDPDVD